MKRRILVTGGAGFIGSSMVRQLMQQGHAVLAVDNLATGKAEYLPKGGDLLFLETDLTSPSDLQAMVEFGPEWIVHLAAHSFIPFCNENPAEAIKVNTYGTQVLLDKVASADSVQKVVFASTAAVYLPSDLPHPETGAIGAIDIYGLSKVFGESLLDSFSLRTGKTSVAARFFNVIGPRETHPYLLPEIINQLAEGKTEIQLGNLSPVRDYIHVDDVGCGVLALLANDNASGAYNIGSEIGHDVVQVIDTIKDILGRELVIKSVPERQRTSDRPFLIADCSRLKSLGWRPHLSFREAIMQTLKSYGVE